MEKKLEDLYGLALSIEKKLASSLLKAEDKNKFCEALKRCGVKKISNLGERVKEGMSLEQFICFVVPIERELNNKVTDVDILIETKDVEENSESDRKKNDLVIVLDNIRSPFNMGAIVRTCDALNVKELIVTGYTPDLSNERVQKISMGAWKEVDLHRFRNLDEVRAYLSKKKYKMISVETVTNADLIYEVELSAKTALVFGNERFGLSKKDLLISDSVVRLPVFGVKNSLNINAALTACGYEWVRQNG